MDFRGLPENGGAERDRTADLLIANEALSQLSYGPGALRFSCAGGRLLGGGERGVKRGIRGQPASPIVVVFPILGADAALRQPELRVTRRDGAAKLSLNGPFPAVTSHGAGPSGTPFPVGFGRPREPPTSKNQQPASPP